MTTLLVLILLGQHGRAGMPSGPVGIGSRPLRADIFIVSLHGVRY